MCRKFVLLTGVVMFLLMASTLSGGIVTDDFTTQHDYLADDVGGTVWDGVIGAGVDESAIEINADSNEPNSLYLASNDARWEPDFIPLGPFLYKNVQSDNWIVIARVSGFSTGVFWNMFGIMARASMDPDEGGTGEDIEQISHFEVTINSNLQAHDDGVQVYDNSVGWLAPYLRLSQVTEVNELGDVNTLIYHEVSYDGQVWATHPASPRLRNDFTGLALQLGLFQANYIDSDGAWGSFSDVTILYRGEGQAWYKSPVYGVENVELKPTLTWLPGPYVQDVNGHEIYISDTLSDVESRNEGVKVVTDTNSYTIGSLLNLNTVYYWCVDEINDTCAPGEWEGDIWHFTSDTGQAREPIPYDGQGSIDPELAEVSWTATQYAVTQDFYFGEDEETVAGMTTPTVADIPNDVNIAAVPYVMDSATSYYWRIESVCGALGTSEGDVWEFATKFPYEICDDFEVPHDYLSLGTEGTIWDGIVGDEYLDEMDASDTNEGKLYIESRDSAWAGYSQGVLLYMEVVGDFSASVEVTDFSGLYAKPPLATNNSAVMARVGDLELAGPGEDWISMDYFPGYGVGNIVRDNNEWRSEPGNEGTDGDRFLQLERRGDVFHLSHSPDGVTFALSPASPIERPDMNGLSLQVGLQHSSFSGTTGVVEYDDFCLYRNAVKKAYAPSPVSGEGLDPMVGILSWKAGDFAVEHNVYFSSDFNDVNERQPAADRGPGNVVDEGGGRFSYDAGEYEIIGIDQTYFWCIDEVNDPCVWDGDVWRFTVDDYSPVDTFEPYDASSTKPPAGSTPPAGTLRKVWVDGYYTYTYNSWPPYDEATPATSGSFLQLNTNIYDGEDPLTYLNYQPEDIAQSPPKSMKFYYDNDGTVTVVADLYFWYPEDPPYVYTPTNPYLSEVYAAVDDAAAGSSLDSLDMARDWSSYNVLKLSFYGDVNNTINNAAMYVGLQDDSGDTLVTIPHTDANELKEPWWHDWYIGLSEFTDKNAELDLTGIARIYIGFGNKDAPAPGGTGIAFFDDIQLLAYGVCIPGELKADLNDDCQIEFGDVEILTRMIPSEMPTLGTPIIDLDASGLSPGDLTVWTNTGSGGGKFFDVNAADANNPVVIEDLYGKRAVTFDITDMLVWKNNSGTTCITAPATLTGDTNEPNDYTVIYEVWNDEVDVEEVILSWARRGSAEPIRTQADFGYGTQADSGAVVHYDADLSFGGSVPAAHTWHTIGVTYDGNTESLAADGILYDIEDYDLIVRPDELVTLGAPFGVSNDPNNNWIGVPAPDGLGYPMYEQWGISVRYNGSLASIKVYGESVAPKDIVFLTAGSSRADLFVDNKINFKDLAFLGNIWMQKAAILGE